MSTNGVVELTSYCSVDYKPIDALDIINFVCLMSWFGSFGVAGGFRGYGRPNLCVFRSHVHEIHKNRITPSSEINSRISEAYGAY